MAPLIVLVLGTTLARLAGWAGMSGLDGWSSATSVGLAAMFGLTASAHFLQPRRAGLIAMVPPRLGRAGVWVTLTGGLELAGAVGLLVPVSRSAAATGLALLLVVMFPANVHVARTEVTLAGRPTTPLGRRAVYQGVYLAACAVVVLG